VILNPYAGALGGRDAVEVLKETPERLAALLDGMSAEAMEARPAPGKWSMREVVAHLADCEIAFSFRLRQAYAGQSQIQPFDQDGWARCYRVYSVAEGLSAFTALRNWNVAFVGGLSEADKTLPTFHPERGAGGLWTIVETMGGHDLHHLAKL
jgi:hypothetical protein